MKTISSWTRFSLVLAAMISVTGLASPVRGEDAPAADESPAAESAATAEGAATADDAPAADADVDRLIRGLSARDFVARREAEQALVSRGAEVVEALSAAAAGGPRETTLRCLEILSRLMRGEDAEAGAAAEEALRGLAGSEDAALAERARTLIEEPADPNDLRPNAGGIRVQIMQQQVVNNRQVSVTEVNGERVVRVKENGREIEIRSRDGKDIRMEVTEEVGGEKKTTEYEADDLDELKEQHPDAAKLYEEFNQQGGGVQVQAFFNVIGGAGGLQLPGRGGPRRNANGADRGAAGPLLDESIENLEKIREGLQQNGDEQSVEELVRRLEEVEQQLRAAREKLE